MLQQTQNEVRIDPFKHSVRIELDWETDDIRMDEAVDYLFGKIQAQANRSTHIFKKQIRVILTACCRMEQYCSESYIAYSRNNNGSKKQKNPFEIKPRSFSSAVDTLTQEGFLIHCMGFNDTIRRRKSSRFKATDKLLLLINKFKLNEVSFYRELINDGIILKNNNKEIIPKYKDTKEIVKSRNILNRYNDFIEQTEIELDCESQYKAHFFDSKLSYRVFNNSSFNEGGRYYGGWWLQCKSGERKDININGENTVELDYKANHLCFIYALEGLALPKYPNGDYYSFSDDVPRKIIKKVFTVSINSTSEEEAFYAIRGFINKECKEDKDEWNNFLSTKVDYDKLLNLLIENHPVVEDYLCSGAGVRLFYLDSQIAEFVLDEMTDKGIPTLCIHDSFIVPSDKEKQLVDAMTEAYDYINYPNHVPVIEKKY